MNGSRADYQVARDSLIEIYEQYLDSVKMVYSPDDMKRMELMIKDRMRQIEQKEFTLVVIGEMKHGKSTFLNAMLQKPAFPRDVREATATVTYMKHNDRCPNPEWKNKAVVEYHNKPEPDVVDHLDLEKYTTCLHKGELNVAEEVKSVTIYTDSKFVKDGVIVVDTPGTNTTNSRHEEITCDQIDRSNAAVFLFKATEAGKASDYSFLEDTAKKIDSFFFVVNRIDEAGGIHDAEPIISDIRSKVSNRNNPELTVLLQKKKFYPTSGLKALLARYPFFFRNELEDYKTQELWEKNLQNNEEKRKTLLMESGMEEFEKDLLDYLFKGERTRTFLTSHLAFLDKKIEDARNILHDRSEALTHSTVEDLERKKALLDAEMENQKAKMESASNSMIDNLTKTVGDFVADSEKEMQIRIKSFENDLETIVSTSMLNQRWSDLCVQINQIRNRYVFTNQIELKDQIKSVFQSADARLRRELNSSLEEANILTLPDFPSIEVNIERGSESFDELRKELEETNEKLEEINKANDAASGKKLEADIAEKEYQTLKEEGERLDNEFSRKRQMLGLRPDAIKVVDSPEHIEKRWRGGVFGFVLTLAFGKTEHLCPEEYHYDTRPQEEYDQELAKLRDREDRDLANMNKLIEQARKEYGQKYSESVYEAQRLSKQNRIKADYQRKLSELNRSLAMKREKAEIESLKTNKGKLTRSLADSLNAYIDKLKELNSSCRDWAVSYIAEIQSTLSEDMQAKRTELENLERLLTEEQGKREEEMKRIKEASLSLDILSEAFRNIQNKINSLI
jgi:energy-coupling factor transporter ATP-binding protein EcfA2